MSEERKNARGRYVMTAKELCYIAVSTALLAVCSWLAVPIGSVPVTLQTLALFVLSGVLGARRTLLSVLTWLALGFFGVPVFAGFTGGIGKLFTPTGGFLLGFLVAAPLIALLYQDRVWQKAVALGVGALVYNVFAVVWFCVLYTGFWSGGLWTAIGACVLPYLPFDLVKMFLALLLAERIKIKIKI